ncbi:MAG: cupin domain-containing protein [Actinobacteria bacterium]|nr:cupin domain-containing protein [Actinomycetota bacterium]
MGIAHWDEVEKRRNERGQMAGTWSSLGSAAGSWRAGANRLELAPGEQPTPPHVHGDSEEIFYVLGGSGLTLLDDNAYEIRAGDCIVYKNFHEAHTIRAGDDGLDVIAFGPREYLASGELPRGRTMWSITGFVEIQEGHPWDREPKLEWPEPEAERPATIVNVQDVEAQVRAGRRRRDLAGEGGSRWTGLKHIELDAGTLSGPPHVHSAEEEIFVVLEGDGMLELTPPGIDAEPETRPVRRGSVVARPPGTGVAHAFRAGDSGMTLIAWGTREPNDICWYPRSQKIYWTGIDVVGRIEQLDYWDGEELE